MRRSKNVDEAIWLMRKYGHDPRLEAVAPHGGWITVTCKACVELMTVDIPVEETDLLPCDYDPERAF